MEILKKTIPADQLEAKISELLDIFFTKRIEALGKLKLKNKLKAKSPYLMKAIGVTSSTEIIEEMLRAHISSSDETIFGNDFFEPLALWVATQVYDGVATVTVQVSGAVGVDVSIEYPTHHEAIAVKSGTKVFNAQSRKKQVEQFETLQRILAKTRKLFEPIVGYCYGTKNQRKGGNAKFKELAGQKFWKHLTGEDEFYLRIIEMMQEKPKVHRQAFEDEYTKAKNKFVKEFSADYTNDDGSIDWRKLTQHNSGDRPPRPKRVKAKKKSLERELPLEADGQDSSD